MYIEDKLESHVLVIAINLQFFKPLALKMNNIISFTYIFSSHTNKRLTSFYANTKLYFCNDRRRTNLMELINTLYIIVMQLYKLFSIKLKTYQHQEDTEVFMKPRRYNNNIFHFIGCYKYTRLNIKQVNESV